MKFRIDIIDTTTDGLVLQEQFTQAKNPVLTYQANDSLYTSIIASQLSFNMLVPDAQDAAFIELFTGDESRYQVKLYDATISDNPILKWQGYLLPEQYSEPYANGSFFVSFVATDRLGLLKNQYLPDELYGQKITISNLLRQILLYTGYDVPIYYAAAIQHALMDNITLQWLEIDLSTYNDNGKLSDVYTVLKNVLESLRVALFQHDAAWHIIGLNRWNDTNITVDRIGAATSNGTGTYTQNYTTINRTHSDIVFKANPAITMLPPYKSVITKFESKAVKNILPKDVVTFQMESNTQDYWLANADAVLFDMFTAEEVELLINYYYISGYREYPDTVIPIRIDGTTNSDEDYIYLQKKFYINQIDFPPTTLSFKIQIKAYVGYDEDVIKQDLEDGKYDAMFRYAVAIGGHNLFGNFEGNIFADYEAFDLSYSKGFIIGKVAIDKVALNLSGYVAIKIYVPKENAEVHNPIYTYVEELELNVDNTKDLEVSKIRAINYTNKLDVKVPHAVAKSTNIPRRILLSDNYNWEGITIDYENNIQELTIVEFQENVPITITVGDYDDATIYVNRVRFDAASHEIWMQNKNSMWLQHDGTGDLSPLFWESDGENIPSYGTQGDEYPDMWLSIWTCCGDNPLTATSKIYAGHEAYTEEITDKIYLYDFWKRYGIDESRKWMDLIPEVHHNVQHEPLVKISGDAFGLLSLFDIFSFTWQIDRKFRPVKVRQNLHNGVTTITIIEDKLTDTQDYE